MEEQVTQQKKLKKLYHSASTRLKVSLKYRRHNWIKLPNRSFQDPRDFFILKRERKSSHWQNPRNARVLNTIVKKI